MGKLSKNNDKNYVYDMGEWEHFLNDVLPDWINNRESYDGGIIYKTIIEFLIYPLSSFIQKSGEKVPNSNLVCAGSNLIYYLDMDLAQKFRDNEIVVLEQIETLEKLVNNFFAIYGTGKLAKTSLINSKNATQDRKEVTKAEIEVYQEEYFKNDIPKRGFKKAAARVFGVHPATISRKLKQ